MFSANKEHKDTLQRMEQKFFEEKVITSGMFTLPLTLTNSYDISDVSLKLIINEKVLTARISMLILVNRLC